MKYSYILLLFTFFSCSEVVSPPKKLISEKEMENVFYDLAILNATKNVSPLFYDEHKIDIPTIIYKKYGVDSLELVENLSFYASNPQKCKEILSRVNVRLEKEDSILKKQAPPIPSEEKLPPIDTEPLDNDIIDSLNTDAL